MRTVFALGLCSILLVAALLAAQPKAKPRPGDGAVTLAPHLTTRTCMMQITPPRGMDALLPGHDAPDACPNEFGASWLLKTVSCYADNGAPTVTVRLTGGTETSVVEKPIPCGERTWMSGVINGKPEVHTFSGLGSTCAEPPCSLEARVVTVKGVSHFVILRLTGEL